jgi:lipopolysaccharide biosynthesis glycosyltransferase
MLRSVVTNLHPDHRLEVYAVDDGLEEGDRDRIATAIEQRAALHWVEPRPPAVPALFTWGGMPLTTYQKVTLGEWLPAGVRKVVWLDCDLLVLEDLARLWREPFGQHLLLAVQDERVPCVASRFGIASYRELGLPPHAHYFNAGVLVVDVARWRAEGVGRRAAAYLAQTGDRVCYYDQEALNAVLAGAWGALDRRWNTNPSLGWLLRGSDRANGTAPGLAAPPWIAHFTGHLKPWAYGGRGPFHTLYYRYVDETPWAGWRPPPSWVGRAVARYEASAVRRWLYPIEQWGTSMVRAASRRRTSPPSAEGDPS